MDPLSIAAVGTIITGVSTAVFGYLGVRSSRRSKEMDKAVNENGLLRRYVDALLQFIYDMRQDDRERGIERPKKLRELPPDPRGEVNRIVRTHE